MNTKHNKRRQASQEKIERALIELLQTKDLSAITVSEIVKKTKLNRSTFYANYADLYALADALGEKLEAEVAKLYQEDSVNSNDYLRLFYHIQNNPLLYKTYFKLGYDSRRTPELYHTRQAEQYFDNKHIAYHMAFFKAGLNAIVQQWLEGGCQETPEEMNEIIHSEYQGRKVAPLHRRS